MNEISIDKAKEIIIEPLGLDEDGRTLSMLNFTRLLMAAEVQSIPEIEAIKNSSHDLVHLSGVHKFRYNMPQMKCEELRMYWGSWWDNDRVMNAVPGLRNYIIDTMES